MAVRVVQTLPRERWAAFVERHPNASIFHTPEMHDVFAATRRHRPEVWATVDHAGSPLVLFTPVSIEVLGGPLRVIASRSVAFAGPLVSPEMSDPGPLEALLREYQARGSRSSVFTEIRNVYDARSLAPTLAASGFRHEAHLNYLVSLEGPEQDIWARIASSARRNIRKANRSGMTVDEAADQPGIQDGYSVLREVYRRIRVPLPDESLFIAAYRILGPLGRFKALVARVDDRPVGVMTLLLHGGVATYWYTGTRREQAALTAGDLLVWKAIEVARSQGCRSLDFGGAGRPDEPYGVRDFKAKFGGVLVDHGRDIWERSPMRMRVATAGYDLMRRFIS